ncbi:MAG TPA: AbrB/MazE/SpoVT family DNA-binding domain-containing protein [bacterium]|nr:AbrB/MazE/SpoVT family DNA-binding domain-containing protein [bacterium]
MTIATTKLSSKGQVVIPESIRKRLRLKEGDQFVVVGEGDSVIFKAIAPPSLDKLDGLLAKVRTQARKAGLQRSDAKAAIARVRKGK